MLFENDARSVDVAERLRKLRDIHNMSLRDLARLSGLSANAISMIERGKSSPSVSTIYKLAEAIEVPITAFFRYEPLQEDIVYRKASEHTRVPFTRGVWEGLGGESFTGRIEPFMMTLETGANSGPFGIVHTGHEFVMCLRGHLEYIVEDELFPLEPGDSLLFASQMQHSWRNSGSTVTNVVFVLSGFQEGERPSEYHLASGISEEKGK